MGGVGLLTAAALRRRRLAAGTPFLYGLLAVMAGAALAWFGR